MSSILLSEVISGCQMKWVMNSFEIPEDNGAFDLTWANVHLPLMLDSDPFLTLTT